MDGKVYPAKYDWWLCLILIASSIGLIVWGAITCFSNPVEGLILLGAGLFNAMLFAILGLPCHYTIADSSLLIRSGVIRCEVPIDQVKSISLSSNPLSAPAPSLKRVSIHMNDGKHYLVSPKDRAGFIREIAAIAGIAAATGSV